MQITQELCKRPGLNKAGFEMQTIYIPTLLDKVMQAHYCSINLISKNLIPSQVQTGHTSY